MLRTLYNYPVIKRGSVRRQPEGGDVPRAQLLCWYLRPVKAACCCHAMLRRTKWRRAKCSLPSVSEQMSCVNHFGLSQVSCFATLFWGPRKSIFHLIYWNSVLFTFDLNLMITECVQHNTEFQSINGRSSFCWLVDNGSDGSDRLHQLKVFALSCVSLSYYFNGAKPMRARQKNKKETMPRGYVLYWLSHRKDLL